VTVAKSLTADLTYNTDFAQVEVDQQQVNLTRFSLFFPEKRDFFLENSGIFDFGPPNRGRDEREINLLDVFFSRRIGLEQGLEVPIEWGGRLTGRLGGFNLGLLNVVTDAVDENGLVVPDTRFSVARLKRNVGRQLEADAVDRLLPLRRAERQSGGRRRSGFMGRRLPVHRPRRTFTTSIYSALLNVSLTPEIRLNTLMQYNDAAELVGLNLRFNWEYRPGRRPVRRLQRELGGADVQRPRDHAAPAHRQADLSLAGLRAESAAPPPNSAQSTIAP
jgi:hypothetical protein